jgi:DNA-binding LytR/AlgR family response regulator
MITFKQNRMDESVYLADILWIEAGDHKSVIHTRNGDITTSTIFKQFQEELKDADFIKPIRFALVSLDAIASIPGEDIKLIDGTIIGVSRDMRKMVKKEYTEYKMKKLLKKGGIL